MLVISERGQLVIANTTITTPITTITSPITTITTPITTITTPITTITTPITTITTPITNVVLVPLQAVGCDGGIVVNSTKYNQIHIPKITTGCDGCDGGCDGL